MEEKLVDIDGEMLPLSEKFYTMYGGSCSQIPMKPDGTSTEWPYDTAKMKACDKKGNHPHIWVRPKRLVRKTQRRAK